MNSLFVSEVPDSAFTAPYFFTGGAPRPRPVGAGGGGGGASGLLNTALIENLNMSPLFGSDITWLSTMSTGFLNQVLPSRLATKSDSPVNDVVSPASTMSSPF